MARTRRRPKKRKNPRQTAMSAPGANHSRAVSRTDDPRQQGRRWAGEAPLRVLVGPYVEPQHCAYMQGAFDDFDTLSFGVWEGADIQLEGLYDLQTLLDALPKGWTPDLMLLWRPEYTTMPLRLEQAQFPVAMLISDWYVSFTSCMEVARFVDAVITGSRGESVYRAAGFQHVLNLPMLGYQEGFDGAFSSEARDIDVLCAGNPNWNVHRERERVVAELMDLPPEVRFVHSPMVGREEYNRLLARSKIFVNQTVIGEINMKCYEVPAAGSCLFVEEDNLDMPNYLVDGESMVLFRRDNLREKILYYLAHEEERVAIAKAGQKAMQSRSYRANMKDIVERLRGIGREKLLKMGREILRATPNKRAGHYMGYAARHTGYGLEHALALVSTLPDELGPAKTLLEGTLQYTACAAPIDTRTGRRWRGVWPSERILETFQQAWEQHPGELCLNLAWAQIAGTENDWQRQLSALDRLIEQLETGCRVPLGGTNLYTLPQSHRFPFERMAWELVEIGVPPDAALRGMLLEYAYVLRSGARRELGDEEAGIQDLRKAIDACPTSVLTRPRLVEALMAKKHYDEAVAVGQSHLEQAPLDVAMRVRLLECEMRREAPDRALVHLRRALRIASVFCDQEMVDRLRLIEQRLGVLRQPSAAAQPA